MLLRFYLDENGDKVYTTKKETEFGLSTQSAHPAPFSPDDVYSRHRIILKDRFGLLPTQQPSPTIYTSAVSSSNEAIIKPPTDRHTDASSSSYEAIIKPPTDRRDYRFKRLSNGFGALLVHDPSINLDRNNDGVGGRPVKAAAAMSVGIGSSADPQDAQGLAHFLEHMLFLGSTKFPKENEFSKYLSAHGGYSNAYTGFEHTCYYFDVEGKALFGALKRLAHMFISPLLNPEAMQREILSVESEFVGKKQDNFSRLRQLQHHTSIPGHLFNRFPWGNEKSLSGFLKDINVQDRLMKLHDDYCCGESMNLVVIGGESLEKLERRVCRLFDSVKKSSPVKLETNSDKRMWTAGKVYKLKSLEDVHLLELSWKLPSLAKHYLTKGEEYISHLLGHEGKGSIFNLLKTKGWASSISAGVPLDGTCRSSIAYIFQIDIHLTDDGVVKVLEVIDYIYQFIKQMVLLSPQRWVFDELRDIGKLRFLMVGEEGEEAEDLSEASYAKYIVENLRVYPPHHVLYGEHACDIWDEEMIRNILGFLKPENMRVDLLTKCFKKSVRSKLEPWFNFEYDVEDISRDRMQLWEDPPTIDSSLHLPLKNQFVACNVSIHDSSVVLNSEKICLLEEPLMTMWYERDMSPLVRTHFSITLNGVDANNKNAAMTRLFIKLVNDKLSETIYMGNEARLRTAISYNSGRMLLKVDGPFEKLPLYLLNVLEVFKFFCVKDEEFRVIKEEMERNLRNAHTNPLDYSNYILKRVLLRSFRSAEEQLDELKGLSQADLEAFIPDLLSKIHIEGRCHGNLRGSEALQLCDVFKQIFPDTQPLEPMISMVSVLDLPRSADFVKKVRPKNESDEDSSVQLYFQIGHNTIELYTLAKLFQVLVKERLFDELRTKQQLGYVVSCGVRVNHGILGFYFYVQSSKYDPDYVRKKLIAFVEGVQELLKELNELEFERLKSGSFGILLGIDDQECFCETSQVGTRNTGLWSLNQATLEHECSQKKKKDLIEWYNKYFRKPSSSRRLVTIQVWGVGRAMDKVEESSLRAIEEINCFKQQSNFYVKLLDENS